MKTKSKRQTIWRANSTTSTSVVLLSMSLILLFPLTDALMCFQCGGTTLEDECFTDYSGLVNTSIGLINIYAKNCTDANKNWTRCMIEERQSAGKFSLFHRGCHDGVTFGKHFDSPRFEGLPPNNETTCDLVGNHFACYTPCDTDFCNGPQVPPNETDPCEDYNGDPYSLPDGFTCGASKLGSSDFTPVTFTILLIAVIAGVKFVNRQEFLLS